MSTGDSLLREKSTISTMLKMMPSAAMLMKTPK
jgi:hypothetical protein